MSDAPLAGLHVLVVEDEFLIALDVEQLCRDHGASHVMILRSLEDFEREGRAEFDFHVAIVDVMLSGRPTTAFARLLLERGIPFIFATGYSEQESIFEGFDGVPIVAKPYVGALLIQAVADAVARARPASGGVGTENL